MDEEVCNQKIREIISIMAKMPGTKQKPLTPLEQKQKCSYLDKTIAELGICVQYLLFDLEATTRERDNFKSMLDHQSGDETE